MAEGVAKSSAAYSLSGLSGRLKRCILAAFSLSFQTLTSRKNLLSYTILCELYKNMDSNFSYIVNILSRYFHVHIYIVLVKLKTKGDTAYCLVFVRTLWDLIKWTHSQEYIKLRSLGLSCRKHHRVDPDFTPFLLI